MPHIKTDKSLTYDKPDTPFSFTATPGMGVIKHFPTDVCEALVKMGAQYVDKPKPSKSDVADQQK